MEQKIIRRFPLPVTEVSEENAVSDSSQITTMSVTTRATTGTNTKTLNFPASEINSKLSKIGNRSIATFTTSSYVRIAMFKPNLSANAKLVYTFNVTPCTNANVSLNASPATISVYIIATNGQVKTEFVCTAGELNADLFEILLLRHKTQTDTFGIFVKATDAFRGSVTMNEISIENSNTIVYYYENDSESNQINSWYIDRRIVYRNVASEVAGFTKQFAIRIYRIPTSEADLMESLFGPGDNGPDGVFDLYDVIKSNIPVIIVLTGIFSDITAITANTNIEYDDSKDIMIFDLSFIYKNKSYNLGFALGDDGTPHPGYESVTIKAL